MPDAVSREVPDDPESLLGRLRRGRGDAVRELLQQPADVAADTLVACLCTPADLAPHVRGYAELVLSVQPDLRPWFEWIERLGPDADDATLVYVFNLLGELAQRGHLAADAFLRRYLLHGLHWQSALGQFLSPQLQLDAAAWRTILPRVGDDDLRLHMADRQESAPWEELAATEPRVRRMLDLLRSDRDPQRDVHAWSRENYAHAPSSQRRWKVLESLWRADPQAAAPLLFDGLWDATPAYRERCVERCDLSWPGVRARLEGLAAEPGSRVAELARRRLAASPAAATGACPTTTIERLPHPPTERDIADLAALLADAVADGAAVSFLQPLAVDEAAAWWRQTLTNRGNVVLVARANGRIVGSVQLHPAWAPNQPHRGDVAKLLVHREHRRAGLGAQLMRAIEAEARTAGRWLLVLDCRAGGPAERLYERLGWVRVGAIPDYAIDADRKARHATVVFYRDLRRDGGTHGG